MSTMTIAPPTNPLVAPTPRPELRLMPSGRPEARPVAGVRARDAVRLTRRGRLAVFLSALVAVLSIGVALGTRSAATERPGTPQPTRVVMVGTGDTLWGIAADVAEDGNVRAMVEKIERLNALDSAMVAAGQRLRIPVAD